MKRLVFINIIAFFFLKNIHAIETFDFNIYKPINIETIVQKTLKQNKVHNHVSGFSSHDDFYLIEFSFKDNPKPSSLSDSSRNLLFLYEPLNLLNSEYFKLFDKEVKFHYNRHRFTIFFPSVLLLSKNDFFEQNSVKLYVKHGINMPSKNENFLFVHAINTFHIEENEHFDKFFIEGLEKNKNKKYTEAIELWNKSLELNPNNIETIYNRGNSKMHNGNYVEAIKDYDYRIGKDNYYLAYMNRGLCKNYLNLKKEALLDFNESIKKNPTFYDSYYNKGIVELDLNLE